MTYLTSQQLQDDLAIRDLTDPSQGPHAIQQIVDTSINALTQQWQIPVYLERGERIVTTIDNYDNLNFPADAISRDSRYTRYVDKHHMLRSHSSAIIPSALRQLTNKNALDVLIACPGIVYRRDSIDRIHTGTPHQIDLWRISNGRLINEDLDEMISLLVNAIAPGLPYRCEPRVHPYTQNGRQIDILWNNEWVEIAECGLAEPAVLTKAGLRGVTGLALGMGLDRLLMLKKNIPDIRLLRSLDQRISPQMLDLLPYRTVSAMPAIKRDLSVAVDINDCNEDIGDKVRDALGNKAELVEEVKVISETPYMQLPKLARQRIGINSTQKNVLVRVVLRPLERTLTDQEANRLRDEIYNAIHQGAVSQWTSERGN